jgi:hypothetical protein
MVDDQTWKACMSSEVFREYLSEELAKEAEAKANAQENALREIEHQVDSEYETWQQLEKFQAKLAENPALKAKLRQARDTLVAYPQLVEKTDARFVRGLELLDLDED